MRLKYTLLLLPGLAAASPARSPFADIFFEPNRGQSPSAVRYFARAPGMQFAFLGNGVHIETPGGSIGLCFAGANRAARFEPLDATPDETFYFVGNDSARWTQHVPHYRKLAWREVYPGIDVIFYGSGGRLEYDLVIAPG